METAYLPVFALAAQADPEQEVEWTRAGQLLYAQAGITTAHDGATHADELEIMKRATDAGANIIDVIAYPFITELEGCAREASGRQLGQVRQALQDRRGEDHDRRLAPGQDRLLHEALPHRRARRREELAGRADRPRRLKRRSRRSTTSAFPLNLHANGDAAIDAFLPAHETRLAGDLRRDRHVTLIHAQFTRKDQLDKYVEYKITPSFYTLHTYYFAEAHIANRGREQAMYISPMRDAIDKGLRPTNHTDFVVAPLDQMFMMWSAVNRISRAGAEIGPDQRVTPLEALKAKTINVADQYGEQASKGTLEAGKLADMVILSGNPLKVDPMSIKDIQVLETLKEGQTLYTRK